MKKNTKAGFSLAEFLIVLTIISILTTLGITISQRGIEKAYNYYFYNGYKSISYAIADAFSNDISLRDNTFNDAFYNGKNFLSHIFGVLGTTNASYTYGQNSTFTEAKTDNNIAYLFRDDQDGEYTKLLISMAIPSANPQDNNQKIVYLLLDTTHPELGLIPSSTDGFQLLDRKDLLPFTIDDGEKGKIVQFYDENQEKLKDPEFINSDKREVYSYREAVCLAYGENEIEFKSGNIDMKFEIKCDNIQQQPKSGSLKLLDPKKVF